MELDVNPDDVRTQVPLPGRMPPPPPPETAK